MADLPKEPVTRQEMYLSRLAGENTTLPIEPVTREEMYLEGAIDRVEAVEQEVEEMKDNPDVVDIVATYADLQAYDTSKLTDKDVIRVLTDETHDGQSTYYRYSKQSDSWTYIGAAGDYYTKTAADLKFQDKLTAGTNVSISAQNVISATDTTYSAFTGTDGTAAGTAGLVPAPAIADAGKFLKADGTWSIAGGDSAAKVLTTSDYNWNSTSQNTTAPYDCVALWLLPSGIYRTETNVKTRINKSTSWNSPTNYCFIVTNYPNVVAEIIAIQSNGGDGSIGNAGLTLYKTSPSGSRAFEQSILTSGTLLQTTGTSLQQAMSQKAVTDIIGDVSTALNAINNGTGA